MSVITISREAGSGGTAIAEAVAATLGYRFVDKQTIGTILAKYGLVGFNRVYDGEQNFWDRFSVQAIEDRKTTISMMNAAILAIAKAGDVVIVGRGGYVVLGGYADVLNVRIQASFLHRVKIIHAELGSSDFKLVEKDVLERDRVRAAFLADAYDIRTEAVSAFDLAINTEKVPSEKAIDMIVDVARSLIKTTAGSDRLVSRFESDPVLANTVAEVLG
jgi:cytidylate kinase